MLLEFREVFTVGGVVSGRVPEGALGGGNGLCAGFMGLISQSSTVHIYKASSTFICSFSM